MNSVGRAVVLVALVAVSGVAVAGVLRVGSPKFDGDKVVFPVILDGEAGAGVSALNFNFQYDPQVLAPYGANNISAGAAAAAADKQVVSNLKTPGDCTVIMMGMNQSSLESGEVASIVMRKVADPQGGRSSVAISQTTLASAQGTEIPSKGSRTSVQFSDGTTQTVPDENPPAQNASATPPATPTPAITPTPSRPNTALPTATAPNPANSAKETPKSQGPLSAVASSPSDPNAPASPTAPNATTSGSQQLATALNEAGRARSSLPVPVSGLVSSASGDPARQATAGPGDSGLSGVAAQAIRVASAVYTPSGAAAQAARAANAVYAQSGSSAQAVKVPGIASGPSGEGGASSAKPAVAPKAPDGPTAAKRSARTKVIVVVVLAVIMVGGFLIRRRIFS